MQEPLQEPMRDAEGASEGDRLAPLTILWLAALGLLLAAFLLGAWPVPYGAEPPSWIATLQKAAVLAAALAVAGTLGGRDGHRRAATEPEAWLCPHCLKPYVPGAHFCPRCGAPLTFYAASARYERVYASAWILGKAAHHPSRPLHVVGLVVIAAPSVGVLLTVLGIQLSTPGLIPGAAMIWSMAVGGLLALIHSALLFYGVRNWRRRVRGVDHGPPEIEYGAPPGFSYDVQWALPEFEVDPSDVPRHADGG